MKRIFALALCASSIALPSAAQIHRSPGDVVNHTPPVSSVPATPAAQTAPEAPVTRGTISLEQAQKNRPLRYIQVEELPPINSAQPGIPNADGDSEVLDEEDLTDPNHIAADEYFIPNNYGYVTLNGIHKLTGRSESLHGPVGQMLSLGQLEVIVHKCSSIVDHGQRGFAGLVEVLEQQQTDARQAYFRGWLFSTSPSLSSIGHPQYDVLLASCSNKENGEPPKAAPDATEEKSPQTSSAKPASDKESE